MTVLKELNKTIGANIRLIRQIRGLSQQQVGDMVGLTFQQIQKYETAKNRISAATLSLLASKLEVNITDFFNATNNMVEASGFDKLTFQQAKAFSQIPEEKLREKWHNLTLYLRDIK